MELEVRASETEVVDVAADRAAAASFLRDEGRYNEAAELFLVAKNILESALGARSAEVALMAHELGATLARSGRSEGALTYYEEALDIRRHVLSPHHPDVAATLHDL